MSTVAPRHFIANPALGEGGLPQDRLARLAARRAFVELKNSFIAAVATLDDRRGEWLKQQIRGAEEPGDLWLLRAPVMTALSSHNEDTQRWRRELRRGLEALFPEQEVSSAFGSFAAT